MSVMSMQKTMIIYIFQHNSKGAIGLLLNVGKIGNITINQLKDIFNTKEGKYEKFKEQQSHFACSLLFIITVS